MTVQLIAGSKIDKEWFYTKDAYSKGIDIAGIYVGQPMPGAHNKGDMRIVATGGLNNKLKTFRHNGTVTTAGTAEWDFTDSNLTWLDDGAIIGFTITWTSGANLGETAKVSAFLNSVGKVNVQIAYSNIPQVGDKYELSLNFKDTNWALECIETGGAGVGEFKFQYNSINVFLGFDTKGIWSAERAFRTDPDTGGSHMMVQAQNGNLLNFFTDSADYLYFQVSYDRGLSWEEKVLIYGGVTFTGVFALVLASGRIMVNVGYGGTSYIYYSDDHGETWDGPLTAHGRDLRGIVELPSGNLFAVYEISNAIWGRVSSDGGLSWSDEQQIVATTNDQLEPTIVVNAQGNLVLAYASNEDAIGYYEIKSKISEDGGVTWGSTIDVANDVSTQSRMPWLSMDSAGILWCAYVRDGDLVNSHYSDKHGAEWWLTVNYEVHNETVSGDTLVEPRLSLIQGHEMVCTYHNQTDGEYNMKNMFEIVTWNGSHPILCPLPQNKWRAYCDVNLQFFGKAIAGDRWEFGPEYQYAPSNIIDDNPKKVYRSEKDNADIELLFGGVAAERTPADAVAVFGCNMRFVKFQMNNGEFSGWSVPSIEVALDLAYYSGSLGGATDGNAIIDFDVDTDFKTHELIGQALIFTSGNESNNAFRIKDNAGEWIYLDTNIALDVAVSDTYRIYKDRMAGVDDTIVKHEIWGKLTLSSNHTPEDYMECGTMIAGNIITLDRAWMPGYTKALKSGIDIVRNKNNELMPFIKSEDKRVFTVAWNANTEVLNEMLALRKSLEGRNVCLIPDSTDMRDIYLVKMIGDIDIVNYHKDTFNFSLTFEEV